MRLLTLSRRATVRVVNVSLNSFEHVLGRCFRHVSNCTNGSFDLCLHVNCALEEKSVEIVVGNVYVCLELAECGLWL